jgi:hypothetical protein
MTTEFSSWCFVSSGYWRLFFQGQRGWNVKIITHLYLAPRLRMLGALLPPSIHLHGVVLKHRENCIFLPLLAALMDQCKLKCDMLDNV